MIIDAHLHLPVGEKFRTLQEKKEKLLAEMNENRVDKCIVIADSWPESEIGSTDELTDLFPVTEEQRVLVAGGISPDVSFRESLSKLNGYLDRRQIVGIKLYTGHEKFYLDDERLSEVYETALRYNVPVLFHSGWDDAQYGNADLAEKVLGKYPELKLVCCHCWYPHIQKCMKLIKYPNMFFDLSSVADDADTQNDIADSVMTLIEKVPDRVIFGSDSFGCSMKEHIRFIGSLDLAPETKQKIFYDNAKRIYQI
ncbi:MAG TPA: amidohydrolase family protein [Ruminococcus flavefaciens]|nr:amidohydrolase family protein [Ruminococcus flavefaciens]